MSRQTVRASLGVLILLIMGASAVYGGGFFGIRDRFAPPATKTEAGAFSPVNQDAPAGSGQSVRKSQAYWRPVKRFEGEGPHTTEAFELDPSAIQWRVKWRCERGDFTIQPQRPSGEDEGHELAEAGACPEDGEGISVQSGAFKLGVQAEGRWVAQVEEQVDVPLIEPPATEMAGPNARMVDSGEFYDIDKEGEGTVKLYRARDGSISLRLERFYVTPNVDLEIRFSELERPSSTEQVADAPFKDIVFLKATTGAMNYHIPAGALSDRIRSVVIWCDITSNAYAAASLEG